VTTLLLRNRFWWTLFVLWFALLFWLSSTVPRFPEGTPQGSDKVLHFLFFGFGGGLLGGALLCGKRPPGDGLVFVLIAGGIGLTGVFDEFHQSFTPGRMGNSIGDMLADLAGGIAAGLGCPPLFRWLRSHLSSTTTTTTTEDLPES